jgi:hypothetical protein
MNSKREFSNGELKRNLISLVAKLNHRRTLMGIFKGELYELRDEEDGFTICVSNNKSRAHTYGTPILANIKVGNNNLDGMIQPKTRREYLAVRDNLHWFSHQYNLPIGNLAFDYKFY